MSETMRILREEVCRANRLLPVCGLVTMHSGNASGLDHTSGRLVIKPSGVDYDTLTPEMLVEVDLETGDIMDSTLRPSVDLPHHLLLYRADPTIGGIIHTHSNSATAFAACGRPIPLCLTAMADQFGTEIPCAPYTDNKGEHIAHAIMQYRTIAPAILLACHGVFTWGKSAMDALKSAVMVEDVAKTVRLAMQIGTPATIPPEEARKWYDRYHGAYGQK